MKTIPEIYEYCANHSTHYSNMHACPWTFCRSVIECTSNITFKQLKDKMKNRIFFTMMRSGTLPEELQDYKDFFNYLIS